MGLGCSGTGLRVPEAGPLATDGLGLDEVGVWDGSAQPAHAPPARVRTCAATGFNRSFPSHGRTPFVACRRSASVPTLCSPERRASGSVRPEGGGGSGYKFARSRRGRWSRAGAGSQGRLCSRSGKAHGPLRRAALPASPLPYPFPRLDTRSRMLCCSVPCRSCVCALGNSCTGCKPTVRTGFLIDGQVGWNKGGSSEWDWAPVRDHSSLMILIPYAILAPRGPSHSSVCSPPTHTF